MLKDQWYIGCATPQLSDQPLAVQLAGVRLVLFRDAQRVAHVLQDRCCHRGFPLSRGTVVDGRLSCGFHGWQYDGAGKCVKIPSQPDKPVPRSYCVESYRCVEKDGYVWVWFGGETQQPAPSIPELPFGNWMQGSRLIQCHYLRALEITFDLMHVYYAHPTHPAHAAAKTFGYKLGSYELRTTDNGCHLFAPPASSEAETPANVESVIEFRLPGRIRFEWAAPNGSRRYMYWSSQPVSDGTCRMDWLVTNPAPGANKILWTEGGREIISEDQAIVEAIQRTYVEEGEQFECSVEADLPALTLRRIVRAAERGTWPADRSASPTRRILRVPEPARWA